MLRLGLYWFIPVRVIQVLGCDCILDIGLLLLSVLLLL